MEVAALRSRVIFQKNAVIVDAVGNHKNSWTDYYACFATIGGEGMADSREVDRAGMVVNETMLTVTVRYCRETATVSTTGFRLMFQGDVYDIVRKDRMNDKKKVLKFVCRKVRR